MAAVAVVVDLDGAIDMPKSQKPAFVKREVASANSNIIRDLSMYHSPSCCSFCQKERTKVKSNRYKKQKQHQSRANTPIVIKLKDTLEAALRHKIWNNENSSGRKCSGVDHDRRSSHSARKQGTKSEKNLNVLLTAFEKDNVKHNSNLESLNPSTSKTAKKHNNVLNNIACVPQNKEETDNMKHTNILVGRNRYVDVICNDLKSSSERDTESPDDSEIDNTSVVSSTETFSDSENSQVSERARLHQKDELQTLAEYTTGFPLFRCDWSPIDCPHCVAPMFVPPQHAFYDVVPDYSAPYHYNTAPFSSYHVGLPAAPYQYEAYYTGDAFIEIAPHVGSSCNIDLRDVPRPVSQSRVKTSAAEPKVADGSSSSNDDKDDRKSAHQLCDIVTAPASKTSDSADVCLSSVYIDLSDTDISFTVFYHDNLPKVMPHVGNYAPPWSAPHASPYHAPFHPTWPPCTYPAFYVPPSYVDIPRQLMVPPSELHKFTANTPPQRQWIPLAHPERSRPSAIFTVMCYNVLCDKYCTRQQYGYCPSWALNWEYRKKTILEEIRQYSADIMTLQEVETEQFYNFFLPELKLDGYDGIFSPKSRARTMTEQERKHVDGCAIFFRTSKFTLIKEHLIEFNQIAMSNAEGSDDMLNRVMTKDNIGIAAMLQTKETVYENSASMATPEANPSQTLLVATAHIHWDPEFCDVKLIQTMMLIRELKMIIESYSVSLKSASHPHDCNDIPLIFCGDLNSQPDSGVIEFLDKGRVSASHEDFKERGYEAYLQNFSCEKSVDALSHNFRLARAYDSAIMAHTNYTYDFKGIIDYIFYSRDTMRCLGVLGALEEEWLKQNKVIGCPHPHVPSDHFSLFVELELPYLLPGRSNNALPSKLR